MKNLNKDSRGIAHLGLIIVAVVVIAGVGFAAWRIMGQKKDTTADKAAESIAETVAEAKCDYDDKDICKFFASYKAHDTYKINGTNTSSDGSTSTSVFEVQGKDKSHMVTSGGGMDIEIITIGKATYTKASDGTWWKQTKADDKPNEYTEDYESDLEEPSKDEPEAAKTVYKLIGKEACGNLECFKYQVVDPAATGTEEFIWFDTKDYQLRRQTTKNAESSSDMTFAYTGVSISEPSPVKELGPNQVLIPGQAEPMTIPTQ